MYEEATLNHKKEFVDYDAYRYDYSLNFHESIWKLHVWGPNVLEAWFGLLDEYCRLNKLDKADFWIKSWGELEYKGVLVNEITNGEIILYIATYYTDDDNHMYGLLVVADDSSAENPVYIGRQPPEGYVPPEGGDRIPHQFALRNTYQSNIVIIEKDIYMLDIDLYEWFHLTVFNLTASYKISQWVCYAILTYFNGNVPYNYYVNLDEDIHNSQLESSMIFEVQTHGERPLNICLDMYNYKIRVEEGVKQKNPKCKQGCCD